MAGISHILADYHDRFFHQLIQVRLLQHPGASAHIQPEPTNFGYEDQLDGASAHYGSVNPAISNAQFQLPANVMRDPSTTSGMGYDGVDRQNTLDQLLETPNWMMNPSSLVFDLNSWQNNDDAFQPNC